MLPRAFFVPVPGGSHESERAHRRRHEVRDEAKETDRLSAIRLLIAAIKQKEVDERIVADDAQIVGIVDRLIKQRKDSIAQFEQAGRTDLVQKGGPNSRCCPSICRNGPAPTKWRPRST